MDREAWKAITVSGVVKGWDKTERLSNNNDKMFYVLFEIVYTLWLICLSLKAIV